MYLSYVSVLICLVCSADLNCLTCSGGVSECTDCDGSASPPRYLRDEDFYCVLETECDETDSYFWNSVSEACESKLFFSDKLDYIGA